MKERPIPFSAPMVRAILPGTKTQTRRVVKLPQEVAPNDVLLTRMQDGFPDGTRPVWEYFDDPNAFSTPCPYGQPGDRLWVREAWRADAAYDAMPPRDIPAGSEVWHEADSGLSGLRGLVRQGKLRPGMFMPRWASRITLEVTGVRVERLQDISEADARAEGIVELPGQRGQPGAWWTADASLGAALHGRTPVEAFRKLWEHINGPGSWALNPWLWVVEFKRATP